LDSFLARTGISQVLERKQLPPPAELGDAGQGLALGFTMGGRPTRLEALHLRAEGVEAFIFVMYPDGNPPPVPIGELARTLYGSLSQ